MSVSDPLIKELKDFTRKFVEHGTDITDDTEELSIFCKCLEKCFQRGVLLYTNNTNSLSFPEAWQWMKDIIKRKEDSLISYTSIVENVLENSKVQESSGRFRLLIRTCLNRKCLHIPVGYLVRTPFLALDYYKTSSILGDEILGEIFYSVLLQISMINFKLNLRNASFLDDTWDLPDTLSLKFVPCKLLGLSICFSRGKTLIIKIEKNSVAAEDERIEVGDILDEINGNVITTHNQGNLQKIMKKSACFPISIYIIKHRSKASNEIFGPIVKIIKSSGIDHMKKLLRHPKLEFLQSDTQEVVSLNHNDISLQHGNSLGCSLSYCGSIFIGKEGDVKQIERAIEQFLQPKEIQYTPIRFECFELSIKISDELSNKMIFKKSYMEISSCGRSYNFPNYFSFISRDTNSEEINFEAHIFYHKNDKIVQIILQNLGQGFYRTHFAV